MSHDAIQTRVSIGAIDNLNIDSAGSSCIFDFGKAARPLRLGFIVTTAVDPDNAVAMTASIYRQVTAHSDTNAVLLGVFKIMAANATNLAAGTVVYKDLHVDDGDGETAEDGNLRFLAPAVQYDATNKQSKEMYDILIGQSLKVVLDTNAEADSGAGILFVEYAELPFAKMFYGNTVNHDVSQDVSTTGP